MHWRQMSAWMLYVVQTSFSGQATSSTSTQQHPQSRWDHPSPGRHPHAPPRWRLYLALMELERFAGSLQTGVNELEEAYNKN